LSSEPLAPAPSAAAMEEGDPEWGLARPDPPPGEMPPLPITGRGGAPKREGVTRRARVREETRGVPLVAGETRGGEKQAHAARDMRAWHSGEGESVSVVTSESSRFSSDTFRRPL
jgi:hypothetical protein